MKSNYNQLGQYIEMVSRTNSDLKYGIEDVRGCSNTKQMMQTRANLIGRTYEKFIVLKPREFVFNRRTTRNGEKIGMAYNNSDREYIFTNDYVAFRVKREYLDKLLPDYLYLFFCRDEFDRYTDWSARDDIKANLQVDLILLLDEFGYPPVTIDDVYKEVLEQAENFKKYAE